MFVKKKIWFKTPLIFFNLFIHFDTVDIIGISEQTLWYLVHRAHFIFDINWQSFLFLQFLCYAFEIYYMNFLPRLWRFSANGKILNGGWRYELLRCLLLVGCAFRALSLPFERYVSSSWRHQSLFINVTILLFSYRFFCCSWIKGKIFFVCVCVCCCCYWIDEQRVLSPVLYDAMIKYHSLCKHSRGIIKENVCLKNFN